MWEEGGVKFLSPKKYRAQVTKDVPSLSTGMGGKMIMVEQQWDIEVCSDKKDETGCER